MHNFTSIITFNPDKEEWHYHFHFEDKETNVQKNSAFIQTFELQFSNCAFS